MSHPRSRWRAEPQTIDGHQLSSKLEARRYGELRLMERAGLISNLRVHPSFDVEINGEHFCRYTADFAYQHKLLDKHLEVVEEVKSSGTRRERDYRLRRKAAELFHRIKITEVSTGRVRSTRDVQALKQGGQVVRSLRSRRLASLTTCPQVK
jgi:hypothetical protein